MAVKSLKELQKSWKWVDITDAIELVDEKTYNRVNNKILKELSPIEFASWCHRTLQVWQDKKFSFIKVEKDKIHAFTDPISYSNSRIEKIKNLNK
jgi:hypothetical protein